MVPERRERRFEAAGGTRGAGDTDRAVLTRPVYRRLLRRCPDDPRLMSMLNRLCRPLAVLSW